MSMRAHRLTAVSIACVLTGCEVFSGVSEVTPPIDDPADAPAEAAAADAADATTDTRDSSLTDGDAADTANATVDTRDAADADAPADSSRDASADTSRDSTVLADSADSAPDTTADSAMPDTAPDTAIPDSAVGDTGAPDTMVADTAVPDTCVCVPGATQTVSGSCASVGDVQQQTCQPDCTWGAAACVTPSGWRKMADPPSGFIPRFGFTALWTGSEMLVYGGQGFDGVGNRVATDGAAYNLATDTWVLMSTVPTTIHMPYADEAAAWSGDSMFLWGGSDSTLSALGAPLNSGTTYSRAANAWRVLPASPLAARIGPATAWSTTTGEFIVWGGLGGGTKFGDGAAYSPVSDTWYSLPSSGLSPRAVPTGCWTGTDFLVWGGLGAGLVPQTDGARYNPVTKVWTPIAPAPSGAPLSGKADAIVCGTDALVSYDSSDSSGTAVGARFLFATGSWAVFTSASDSVVAGSRRTAEQSWIGTASFGFWSGERGAGSTPAGGGALLDAASLSWSPMAIVGEPHAREGAAAVYTGRSTVIWGGEYYDGTTWHYLSDGAVYAP